MWTKVVIAAALGLLATLAVAAQPMSDSQLDLVVAGWGPHEGPKGNNGWGNGADPTNPGSFKGKTAPSKSCNCSRPSAGKINTNPTTSSGR